jgi:hypothetical protein
MRFASCSIWFCYSLAAIGVAVIWPTIAVAGDEKPARTDAAPAQKASPAQQSTAATPSTAAYATETLRGRVVWMADALARRYGIETDPDAAQAVMAIETADGRLIPIVKDFRSRGFWLDPRLRAMELEVVARRYEKSPVVQIVRWYAFREGRRYEVDYWCDICAIPMYELKPCECCQGDVRLRERLVERDDP